MHINIEGEIYSVSHQTRLGDHIQGDNSNYFIDTQEKMDEVDRLRHAALARETTKAWIGGKEHVVQLDLSQAQTKTMTEKEGFSLAGEEAQRFISNQIKRAGDRLGTRSEMASFTIPIDNGITITLPARVSIGQVYDVTMEGKSVFKVEVIDDPVLTVLKQESNLTSQED